MFNPERRIYASMKNTPAFTALNCVPSVVPPTTFAPITPVPPQFKAIVQLFVFAACTAQTQIYKYFPALKELAGRIYRSTI